MSRIVEFLLNPWDEKPKKFTTRAVKPETIIRKNKIPFPVGYEMLIVDGEEQYLIPTSKNIKLKSALVKFILMPKGKMADFFVGLGLVIAGTLLTVFSGGLLSTIGGYMIAGGATMMVGAGVRMLMGQNVPNVPSLADASQKASYAITGAKNQLGIGNPFPIVFGKHKIVPPIVGQYYTTQGDNSGKGAQYVNMLLAVGYRDLLISDIRIGNNELASNSLKQMNGYIPTTGTYTADLEVRQGSVPSLYPTKVYEQNIGASLEYYDGNPTNIANTYTTIEGTTQIIVGIVFQGLVYLNSNGGKDARSVKCQMWYRPAGSTGNWRLGAEQTFTGNDNFIYRWQMSRALTDAENEENPSGKWEVYVCRVSKESTDSNIIDKGFVGYLQSKTNKPVAERDAVKNLTFLAVRIKATEAAQAQLDQISCIASSILPVKVNGAWTSEAETANPAAIFRAVALGKYNNRKTDESRIDSFAIDELYDWCILHNRTCNAVISEAEPKIDLLNKILSTCQSRFFIRNGLISLALDGEKTTPVRILTPKNSRNFQATRNLSGYFNVMDATWTDAAADYKQTNEDIRLPSQVASPDDISQKVDLFGTTNHEQAYYMCRYLLACAKYRTEQYTLDVDIDQINIPIGSLVEVAHDVLKVSLLFGRIKSWGVDNGVNYIQLDETVSYMNFNQNLDYGVKIIQASSGAVVHIPVRLDVQNPLSDRIILDIDPNTLTLTKGDIYAFGEFDKETLPCYVLNKEPLENYGATLTLVPYVQAIYDETNETPPPYDPKISSGTIGQIPVFDLDDATVSTLTIENQGQIFFDFAPYNQKTDDDGDYYFNRGNLRDVAKMRLTSAVAIQSVDDANRSLPIHYMQQDGSKCYSFYVDNTMWKSQTIECMVKNLDVAGSTAQKWLWYYQDTVNKNELGLFVRDGALWVVVNSFETEVEGWVDKGDEGSMLTVVRDFNNLRLSVYQDTTLCVSVVLHDQSIQLSDEPVENWLISQDSPDDESGQPQTGLGTETEAIIKLGVDRNVLFNFLGNGNDGTGAACDIADLHIWDIGADTEAVENIYKSGIVPIKVGKVKTYLGEFPLAPERAKLGDYFLYNGPTTDLLFTGAYYQLMTNGWQRIDSLNI